MNHARFSLSDSLVLDARKAAWFPRERVLAVADLHVGYAWAHRARGQLLPILPANDTLPRLLDLQREYEPREIIVLGDLVHRAGALPVLEEEIRSLFSALSPKSQLTCLAGNHDRGLGRMLEQWKLPPLQESREVDGHLLVHGDRAILSPVPKRRIIMGHEHPAISIGDGVTTRQKCPCFLVSESVLVMPAFSRWAAGSDIRAYNFMSETARNATFTQAIAICGGRLLPISV